MKRHTGIISFIALLSIVTGYLLSKVSIVGRMGMTLFYREYNFLKSWWKGSLLVFGVLLLLLGLHGLIRRRWDRVFAGRLFLLSVMLALVGLYVSYDDFRHTISHHLLGERFHIGVYLFWIGWIVIAFYFIVQNALLPRLPSPSAENKPGSGPVTGTDPDAV